MTATVAENPRMARALRYASRGYRVFPCIPGKKRPLTTNGHKDATTDADQIIAWWTKWPDANIGIATQGLVAVDIDGAQNLWPVDPQQRADLHEAPTAFTPRGGVHHLFQCDDPRVLRCTASTLAPGVDTRSNGGYIIVAPSEVGGVSYEWRDGDLPPRTELPKLPAWLVDLLVEPVQTRDRNSPAPEATPMAIPADAEPPAEKLAELLATDELFRQSWEGFRADLTDQSQSALDLSLARRAAMRGWDDAEIAALLLAARTRLGRKRSKALRPDYVARTLRTARQMTSFVDPDVEACSAHFLLCRAHEMATTSPEPLSPKDPGPFPPHLLEVPGFMGDVYRYTLETAHRPQPVLALAGAIVLQAVLAARKVCDQRGNRTNLYVVGVASSGSGKDHPRAVGKRILAEADLAHLDGNDDIASDSGLVAAVHHQPAIIFYIDEFGRHLRTLSNAQSSPYLFGIMTCLMKLFSSADRRFTSKAYADRKRIFHIDQPCVCLLGTTAPDHFYGSLNGDSLREGSVSRMLIFESSDVPSQRWVEVVPIPETILKVARWWGAYGPNGNLTSIHPAPAIVPADPAARAVFTALMRDVDAQMPGASEERRAILARIPEKAARLALVYACSANHEAPVVNEAAAVWGRDVALYLTDRLFFLADQHVAENDFDRRQKQVVRVFQTHGPQLSLSELTRRTRSIRPVERQEVMNNLILSGQIVLTQLETTGRTAVIYRLVEQS
jgi:hypothetical protein